MIRVAILQNAASKTIEEAHKKTEQGLEQAYQAGAKLALLSELHSSPYFCQNESTSSFAFAEKIPGKTTDFLSHQAKKWNMIIIGSIFEERAPGLYHNTAIVFEKNGELVGKYRKMHIPDDPNYYEKFYFTPGDLGFTPIQTSIAKLGVLVCWDQWFPEAARIMALRGAEILLYPTAIAWHPEESKSEQKRRKDAWITIQRSHAIANGLPLLSANRVGKELDFSKKTKGLTFWGSSFICDAGGQILSQASSRESMILINEINLAETQKIRQNWPFLRDRRIDAYETLLARYEV